MTSALFEHVHGHSVFLVPGMCTPPSSNINHAVTKIMLLFSSKRCEHTDLSLTASELEHLYYGF